MEEIQGVVWDHYIAPSGLLDLIWNTAPYLKAQLPDVQTGRPMTELASARDGFLRILAEVAAEPASRCNSSEEALLRYFALCLASHHSTVATYVPTDVDSKIRGLLWKETRDTETLRAMFAMGEAMHGWTLDGYSLRTVECGAHGIVSGHDGEWLSVMAGALGRFLALGDTEYAEKAHAAIHAELIREARCFVTTCLQAGRELDTMRAAMSVIHNLGDLNQGISFWSGAVRKSESALLFERLAQENVTGYGGIFRWPGDLYKEMLASEGHRHYPLRAVKPLRKAAELMLPLGPFLDDYGAHLATTPLLNGEERSEALDALIRGCKKVPNQQGYYRAIAGFREASHRAFDDAAGRMGGSTQKILKEPDLRQKTAVAQRSFESRFIKRVEQMRKQHGSTMERVAASLA
ncbi:MAG TPA: hypothetical protein VFQ91_16815 [Bryobacteraceae bacterium]|nr:hypothetical protein [Bryobacteraceae bacterium]